MLSFSSRCLQQVPSRLCPVSSPMSLSASVLRRSYGNGCDVTSAVRPEISASERQPSRFGDNDFYAIDQETGLFNDCDLTAVTVDNREQRKTTSGVPACSFLSESSASASRSSRSFTIDAILGRHHLHHILADNDDDNDDDDEDSLDGCCIQDESVGVEQNSPSVTPMDCSRLKVGRESESNTSCDVYPVDCVSRNGVIKTSMFDTCPPEGARSTDHMTNGHFPGVMTRHYPQHTPLSPILMTLPVAPPVGRSDVAVIPLSSDVRPLPADLRTASQSPWRRQQQQQLQQPSSHRGMGHHHHHRGKRVRTIFTADQLHRLEAQFEQQQYMVGTERYFLASSLRLTEAQVKVWFQNRRIKWRKQSIERQQAKMAVVSYNRLIDAEDDGFDEVDGISCSEFNDATDNDTQSDVSAAPRDCYETNDVIRSTQLQETGWQLETASGRHVHASFS